jgi:hypothetical protein
LQLQIQIIKVGKVLSKGTYKAIEVTYKDLNDGGKVKGKNLVDFGDYAHVFEAAKSWQEDEVVTVENIKIMNSKTGKEFWTWVDVLDTVAEKEVVAEAVSDNKEKPAVAAPTKQQWVPDEAKQRLIVRQSCLAQAVNFEKDNAPSVESVLILAERFFDWVYEKPVAKGVGRPKKVVQEPEDTEVE